MRLLLVAKTVIKSVAITVLKEKVLSGEYLSARELYPIFCKEMEQHTAVEPILARTFQRYLSELVRNGDAEVIALETPLLNNGWARKDTHYYRRLKKDVD